MVREYLLPSLGHNRGNEILETCQKIIVGWLRHIEPCPGDGMHKLLCRCVFEVLFLGFVLCGFLDQLLSDVGPMWNANKVHNRTLFNKAHRGDWLPGVILGAF